MPATARHLRASAHAATYHGLQAGRTYVDTDGRLCLVGSIYVGVTGHIPDVFGTDPKAATDLIEANPDVMAAVWAVSNAIGTDAPTDSETGAPCPIEHLWYWQLDRRIDTGKPPTPAETVGLLLRAANAEYARTGTLAVALPGQRTAA